MLKGRLKEGCKNDKKKERATRRALRRERRYKDGDPEFKSLANQLAVQGLKLKDVPGDGNCLFRALADQMDDPHTSHRYLRTDIVEYMRTHEEDFKPFMEEEGITYGEYINDLMKDGTYGGNDTIVAFARYYSCSVIIHQLDTPLWEVHGKVCASKVTPTKIYHVAYLNGEHYCSVVPIDKGSHPVAQFLKQPQPKECVSVKEKQTSPQLSHSATAGMLGMHEGNDLLMVMEATGCKDKTLAESALQENAHDLQMAIVELLQIMDISGDVPTTSSDPLTTLRPLPQSGEELKKREGSGQSEGINKKKTRPQQEHPPQRHHSNRERKEQAKKERKERRKEDRREKKETKNTLSPLGSLAI